MHFQLELENHFGYKYNLSGFECLSVLNRFSDFYSEAEKKDVAKVVATQFSLFDMENREQLGEQSYDANTYVASCYKALIT